MAKQIKDFLLHLRLNYNILILSGPFLLGAVYVGIQDLKLFIFHYIVIHVLLFGGANAYNSYFDKDEGPIGGLKNPPKMKGWMYYASWIFQIAGLLLSIKLGPLYVALYLVSMFASWLYSGPTFRFKGRPLLSFFAIGVGTAITPTMMGFLAAGGLGITLEVILGSIGTTLVVLSMYPFSQVYQVEEDSKRGDKTFAVVYGASGVKRVFKALFPLGIILLSVSFISSFLVVSITFLIVGTGAFVRIWPKVRSIKGDFSEYEMIMKTKYYGGLIFTVFILVLLFLV